MTGWTGQAGVLAFKLLLDRQGSYVQVYCSSHLCIHRNSLYMGRHGFLLHLEEALRDDPNNSCKGNWWLTKNSDKLSTVSWQNLCKKFSELYFSPSQCYKQNGDVAKATEWLKKATSLPVSTDDVSKISECLFICCCVVCVVILGNGLFAVDTKTFLKVYSFWWKQFQLSIAHVLLQN